MAKLADLIEERTELLATIDAWDNGQSRSLEMVANFIDVDFKVNPTQSP